jgi:polyferredoxin
MRPAQHVAIGTPYFVARSKPCEMCEDIPCVKACPTGALDHALTDITQAKMGLAVLVDQENCLNFLGLRCDVCYRVCPVIDKAITLRVQQPAQRTAHAMFLPTVHSEHCTGCGKCEKELRAGRWPPSRYWILALVLLLAVTTGGIVWELVNPVSMLPRGLMFGMGAGWLLIGGIFLFDTFVMKRGWCSYLCPVGAFYSLLGRFSLVRVKAGKRDACNDCLDCFVVCPEQQVIKLPLKGAKKGASPVILSGNCTNCGRCIDVCSKDVFSFSSRFSSGTGQPGDKVLPPH